MANFSQLVVRPAASGGDIGGKGGIVRKLQSHTRCDVERGDVLSRRRIHRSDEFIKLLQFNYQISYCDSFRIKSIDVTASLD